MKSELTPVKESIHFPWEGKTGVIRVDVVVSVAYKL